MSEELSPALAIPYPRKRFVRGALRTAIKGALALLSEMEVIGRDNLPEGGPLIIVGNHFSFIDPVAVIGITPWPVEYLSGFRLPNAPPIVRWIPKLYGVLPVHRGSVSRSALRSAESVLCQDGVVGIFPEGGNWATVLRPARPGAAYLAARTQARILPIGIDGVWDIFPHLRKGKRAKVTIRIGKPFGPFKITGRGRERREQLDEVGHTMMQKIAELIPPELRGHYSNDPAIRAAAKGTEIYPWDEEPET